MISDDFDDEIDIEPLAQYSDDWVPSKTSPIDNRKPNLIVHDVLTRQMRTYMDE
jgi:hypothetical protein